MNQARKKYGIKFMDMVVGGRKESRKITMLKYSAMQELMGFEIGRESCRTLGLLLLVNQAEVLFY